MVASRALIAAGVALAACAGSVDVPDAPDGADAGVAGGAAPAPVDAGDAALALLPYPGGPYGASIGDVVADFDVQGFELSREQRDSRKLPFRDISMAEVRSHPECTCLVVLWNATGNKCVTCTENDAVLTAALLNDRSLCALEVIYASLDSNYLESRLPPPTRADLELYTEGGRQAFPVGLYTKSALTSLGWDATPDIPAYLFIRPSDMRIVGIEGNPTIRSDGRPVLETANARCAAPTPPKSTIATGVHASGLAVDGTNVYFPDDELGIVGMPASGGATTTLAKPQAKADSIVVDGDDVFWATKAGEPTFEIGQVSKVGGSQITLASGPARYSSIAVERPYMYFARTDGVVGRLPVGGGAIEPLYTGEATPTSIAVDQAAIYWVNSAGDVLRGEKDGSVRTILAANGSLKPFGRPALGLAVVDGLLLIRAATAEVGTFALLSTNGGPSFSPFINEAIYPALVAVAPMDPTWNPNGHRGLVVSRAPNSDRAAIGWGRAGGPGGLPTEQQTLMPGLRGVTAIAAQPPWIYWVEHPDGPDAPASIARMAPL
jgi:hypothetical protein